MSIKVFCLAKACLARQTLDRKEGRTKDYIHRSWLESALDITVTRMNLYVLAINTRTTRIETQGRRLLPVYPWCGYCSSLYEQGSFYLCL